MRSRANVLAHPIHPMLIPFPMAFLFGALFFDLVGLLGAGESWMTTGAFLSLGRWSAARSRGSSGSSITCT